MSTTTPAARPPRRRGRWLAALFFAGGFVAAPVVIYFVYAWTSGRALEQQLAELDEHDPGWRWNELVAARAKLPDDANSAVVVAQVVGLMGRRGFDFASQKEWELFYDCPSEAQLNEPQLAVLREAMGRYEKALPAARRLKDLPEGRCALDIGGDLRTANLEPLDQTRRVFYLLEYDAMLRGHDGDAAGAAESCRALLNAARSLGDEPFLVASLIRYAGQAYGVNAVERLLAQTQPQEDQLRPLQELLQKEAEAPVFLPAMRGERARLHRQIEQVRRGETKTSSLLEGAGAGKTEGWIVDLFPASLLRGQAELLRLFTQVVDAAKLPPEKQADAVSAVHNEVQRSKEVLVRLYLPAMQKVAEASRRSQAYLRSAVVAVATERYRLRHGTWPASVEQLVQDGLLQRPVTDPFDGAALRLRRLPDGMVVYSVGFDLADNGGTFDPLRNPMTPNTDLGLRLWDPASRRQPALPPPE